MSFKDNAMAAAIQLYQRSPILRKAYRPARRVFARQRLKRQARRSPCRIVIGANKKYQEGWIPTEVYTLDIRDPHSWQRYFQPASIDAMLAEHVWEHLTLEEGLAAARLCRLYLKPGARLRVAVPDGYFPDPGYIDFVKPGGIGPSAWDHKVLYTHRTLAGVFQDAGFDAEMLEHHDERGIFHAAAWNVQDGFIERSSRKRNARTFGGHTYTSIILDAWKRDDNP